MNDVRRAYYYAKAIQDVYIELPKEDPHSARGDLVGKSKLCLYGTRDAALNWQETVSQYLIDNGFERGVGFPSVFVNKEKDIWTLVHGDPMWLDGLLSKRYEIKTQRARMGKVARARGICFIALSELQTRGSRWRLIRGTPSY